MVERKLPVDSDLTEEAFLECVKLLQGEDPLILGASREVLTHQVISMVQRVSPITAIVAIPEPVLSTNRTWFVAGTTIVAFSQGF